MIKLLLKITLVSVLFISVKVVKSQSNSSLQLLNSLPLYTSLNDLPDSKSDSFRLNVSGTNITEQNLKELATYTNLLSLNLSKCKLDLTSVDTTLSFDNLLLIDVSKNKLTKLPGFIFNSTQLLELRAGKNDIAQLQSAIGNLKQLEILDLWGNNITYFPIEIEELQNLKFVDLRVITLSDKEQQYLTTSLPNTKIEFSNPCNCY
jgi:Leucine-rich repeat (LRR) protein